MANYYETARTNYFRVKDEAAFRKFIDTVGGAEIYADQDGRFCVLFTEEGVPSCRYNDETEDYDALDFMDELAQHLADGSPAVLVAAGAEKLRYVCGYATAVNNTGKQVSVSIRSIYELAEKELGGEVTIAEY